MTRNLDKRLEAAAGMIRSGAVAADIGTDHGYLIIELVKSGRCPRGYACDINPAPLLRAEKNIELSGLADKIETVLTDGLDKLEGLGIDDFAVLGMGGDLIADIVTRRRWTRDKRLRFILQPMTKPDRLRRALYKAGFAVEEEKAVKHGRFVYSVMRALYTGESKDICELFAHTGLVLKGTDADSRLYLSRTAARLQRKADGLRVSGTNSADAVYYSELAEIIRRKSDVRCQGFL